MSNTGYFIWFVVTAICVTALLGFGILAASKASKHDKDRPAH